MNKKDFFEKLERYQIEEPIIFSKEDETYVLSNIYWVVEDHKDFRKKFCTPSVRMSSPGYHRDSRAEFSKFITRKKKLSEQYIRWIEEYNMSHNERNLLS